LYNRKQYEAASKHFEKVVNLYPFDYQNSVMLAWTYLRLGKNNEAKILFNKVLMVSPNDASALEGLALIK
jgi:Flp pilus assembly protein TadD